MNEQIKNVLAKIVWRDLVYPLILLIFLTIVVTVFISSVKFFYTRIDTAISLDESAAESGLTRIDMGNLAIVARKLNIPISETAPAESVQTIEEPPTPTTEPIIEATPPVVPEMPVAPVLDPKTIKIAVYNSTDTTGLAGKLKTALETSGFVVSETGNKPPTRDTTIVQIKESLADTGAQKTLSSVVAESYVAVFETLPPDTLFDIIVIIGSK